MVVAALSFWLGRADRGSASFDLKDLIDLRQTYRRAAAAVGLELEAVRVIYQLNAFCYIKFHKLCNKMGNLRIKCRE